MLPDLDTGGDLGANCTGKGSLSDEDVASLKVAAQRVAGNSYSPYSGFPVGAAVLSGEGKIYTGTNVENASYGLSICAERVAVSAAATEGTRSIKAVAIYTSTEEPSPPCGACLSFIAEFARKDVCILMFTKKKEHWAKLSQLLPLSFRLKPKETS